MGYIDGQNIDDTTYVLPAVITTKGDSTYIDVSKEDIKSIHDRIFVEEIGSADFMTTFVRLEILYMPVMFFILFLVTIVNLRWNRAFKRLQKLRDRVEMTPDLIEKIGILKAQRVNLWDRSLVYIILMLCSFIIDFLVVRGGITDFPFGLIVVTVFMVTKILQRLVDGSTLSGQNDEDILVRYKEAIEDMIVQPLIGSFASSINRRLNVRNYHKRGEREYDRQHEEDEEV